MNLWLLQKEMELTHIPSGNLADCRLGICQIITESFERGELAAHEALDMITGILKVN